MKYSILVLSASLILSSCNKKTEESNVKPPDTTNSDALKKAMDHLDKNAFKTHRGAFNALLDLPVGGPIPPHMLPAKDVKLIEESDSIATYTFISEKTGIKGKVKMKRRITGQDTTWIVIGINEIR